MTIRAARSGDLARLVEIEHAAGQTFLQLDPDLFAGHDPGTVAALRPYADGGRAFVTVDADDRPVGYLILDVVDAPTVSGRSLSPPTSTSPGTASTTRGSASAT